jgi:hypothetical protein
MEPLLDSLLEQARYICEKATGPTREDIDELRRRGNKYHATAAPQSSQDLSIAVEYGYRACEKGQTLQQALEILSQGAANFHKPPPEPHLLEQYIEIREEFYRHDPATYEGIKEREKLLPRFQEIRAQIDAALASAASPAPQPQRSMVENLVTALEMLHPHMDENEPCLAYMAYKQAKEWLAAASPVAPSPQAGTIQNASLADFKVRSNCKHQWGYYAISYGVVSLICENCEEHLNVLKSLGSTIAGEPPNWPTPASQAQEEKP